MVSVKKSIVMLMAGISLLGAPAAYAEPVKITGEVSVKYERDTATDTEASSAGIYTLKLLGEAELGNGWSLYARLGAQALSKPGFGDFSTDHYGNDKKTVAELDQFGLIHKTEKITYKLGRQDAAVGATALLYSRPDSNIGKKVFVDGLSASGTAGATDLSLVLAREDNPAGVPGNKVYAVRAGHSPQENLNLGLTLGRYQDSANGSSNHWAVDGTFKFANNTLTAEYTRSNRSADNKAYALSWSHDLDDKTALSVTAFRVEASGDMGGQSDFDNGNKGVHYGLTRKLSDSFGLEIVFKDQKVIADGTKNTKLEATVTYSF